MQGRKPLEKANLVKFPGSEKTSTDEPRQADYDAAKKMCPPQLNENEKAVWLRVAPELSRLGRLRPHFVDALAEYCIIVEKLRSARKLLDEKSWTYATTGRNGQQVKMRPEVAQLNDDWRKWRSLVGEFGLAPGSDRGLKSGQSDLFNDDFDF